MRGYNHTQQKVLERVSALCTTITNVWAPKILAGMKLSSEKNFVMETLFIACPCEAILILYMILLLMTSQHENNELISSCGWCPFLFCLITDSHYCHWNSPDFLNLNMFYVILNSDKGRKETNYDMTNDCWKAS